MSNFELFVIYYIISAIIVGIGAAIDSNDEFTTGFMAFIGFSVLPTVFLLAIVFSVGKLFRLIVSLFKETV